MALPSAPRGQRDAPHPDASLLEHTTPHPANHSPAPAGADLTNAVIDRVAFNGSDFTGARFVNAVITGTTFDGANLAGADFEDALIGG